MGSTLRIQGPDNTANFLGARSSTISFKPGEGNSTAGLIVPSIGIDNASDLDLHPYGQALAESNKEALSVETDRIRVWGGSRLSMSGQGVSVDKINVARGSSAQIALPAGFNSSANSDGTPNLEIDSRSYVEIAASGDVSLSKVRIRESMLSLTSPGSDLLVDHLMLEANSTLESFFSDTSKVRVTRRIDADRSATARFGPLDLSASSEIFIERFNCEAGGGFDNETCDTIPF
jgi:hypothetical protein